MKPCRQCGAVKPLQEFYKHAAMADGHLNKCRECVKARVANHRADNAEAVRAYDVKRAKQPHRQELRNKVTKRMRKQHPEKYRAQTAVGNAIRDGKLARRPCERCGAAERVHAHHDDYARPLEVQWLCPLHHKQRHRELEAR